MNAVDFYFDVLSPYSWLALAAAADFADRHPIRWRLRPVSYVAVLKATGLVGPVETEAKRRYTFLDVARCALRAGRPFRGPPRHPFRSLEAQRLIALHQDAPSALALARNLAAAAWEDGSDLTDPAVLAAVAAGVGLQVGDLPARIAGAEAKALLHANTAAALGRGVFGVPTFAVDDELFWGHDRMDHLGERLAGRLQVDRRHVAAVLARPWGVAPRLPAPPGPTPGRGRG